MNAIPSRLFSRWILNGYRSLLRHPKYRWLLIGGTLLYFISPLDLAPDALPLIGWLDDGIVASLLVTEMSQLFMEYRKSQKGKAKEKSVAQASTVKSAGNQPNREQGNVIDVDAVFIK